MLIWNWSFANWAQGAWSRAVCTVATGGRATEAARARPRLHSHYPATDYSRVSIIFQLIFKHSVYVTELGFYKEQI